MMRFRMEPNLSLSLRSTSQVLNLVFLTFITYFLVRFCPMNVVQRFIFSASVIYLSALHLVRQIYDYGSYTVSDILTGF